MVDYSVRYLRWYQYVLEIFPLWLVLSYAYVAQQIWPPLMEFLLIALVLGPLTGVVLNKLGGHRAVYVALPIILGASLLVGFNVAPAAVLATFITIRMENRYIKPDQDNESALLMITFLLAIMAYIVQAASTDGFAAYYLGLFVVQVFVWLAGRLIYFYLRDDQTWRDTSQKKVFTILTSVGVLGVLTWLVYVLFPYVKFAINTVLYWALYAFAWLVSPIFDLLGAIQVDPPEVENDGSGEPPNQFEDMEGNTGSPIVDNIIDIIIYTGLAAVVVVAIIGYTIYRRKLFAQRDEVREQMDDNVQKEKLRDRKWFKRREKVTPPTHEVRKAYFELERWAAAHELGRYQYETILDWLHRLGVDQEVDSETLAVYEQVRYYDQSDIKGNVNHYFNTLEHVKTRLKEKYET
ncbi:MFS family permease [Alkalibacillus flavidus]|uniref:MFS family permease n=1 Tax=Alkalibacillus flavidus TaxID=546021 RepID=A0ABV2KU46_9BACI